MQIIKSEMLKKSLPPISVTILITLLLLIGISRYFFYNIEKDIYEDQLVELETTYKSVTWSLIEGTIRESSLAAQSSSLYVSNKIVENIRHEYPDLIQLKNDLDNNLYYETKLPRIIMDNIKNKYFYNIHNEDNDIFVMTYNGIVVDPNVSNIDRVYRSFDEEIKTHFNYELANEAFEKILKHRNYSIIYYEPKGPENIQDHEIIVSPTYDALYKVFMKEGIDGLKGYTILVPTYITEDGDIFGTPDINIYGKQVKNHKMIVVQRFNIYDVLMNIHEKDLSLNESTFNSMKIKLVNAMNVRTLTYISVMILDLSALILLMFCTSVWLKTNKIKQNDD